MCGFLGRMKNCPDQYNEVIEPIEQIDYIHNRSPDDYAEFSDEYLHVGFRRLAIIDLEKGSQPMSYQDDRYCIVFNGEIYNYIELKETLKTETDTFTTDSDTEVILALYDLKQEKALEELRGMFSFVIWDRMEQRLFAARDSFGIKPFYYIETDDYFIFASEKKSLIAFETDNPVSQEALQHYLSFQYVPEPHTISGEIQTLKAGHYLTKTPGEDLSIHQYNELIFHPVNQPFTDLVNDTRLVLDDSVEKHMRSDVPVGAFLSGGIDSTSIVALAKQYNPNIKTFTVGFRHKGFSEIEAAKETADKLGVENIHKVITPDEFIETLPHVVWHMDDPVADPAAVALYFVAKEASKHVKVVLSGEGADEVFGGYNIYREPLALRGFRYLPGFTRKVLRQLALLLPEGMKGKSYLLRGTTPLSERYIGNANIFSEIEKKRLLSDYRQDVKFTDITGPLFKEARNYDDSLKMQYIDIHTWLRGDILVKADRMTMAHSLELRVPFLDKEVFKLASELPVKSKIARGTTKYVLREAMKGIVPDSVLTRKKLGFPVPIRHWLRNEIFDWAYNIIQNSPTEQYIKKQEALHLLEQHALGKMDYSRKIWTVLMFMLWHELYPGCNGK
ncbi:asparagine synthase (glutamine-hydrolyzing) [Virgibacillus profundi]|uniref:asparagine synthase (glutamine-hydrolyzing) n=1 Tax=Virgibacillus profundi TaxID=2024555 RepID=A0A2A2ICP6_9BACI|nr:asparagine synthase (glutamine-hydrolyzing) [Virgibacillus profundi]PAV29352.1 asparagine synthase (glutamine-hydrolyzing) [Virgibacillus profundi]PXY53520.1 asparagine synthase (glutamine-hydrolyzing) [Virgibacillus profundi]